MTLDFRTRGHGAGEASKPQTPFFYLTTDRWDDFGHKVQFHLAYVDKAGVETRIGAVKILQKEKGSPNVVRLSTSLPSQFKKLDSSCISLGQEDSYYKTLHKLFGEGAEAVLAALNDIAWTPVLASTFEPTTAYRNALMRENGAQRARRFGREWALGHSPKDRTSFSYSCQIEGAAAPVKIDVDFNGRDDIPGRVVGIIGRNAVGKTRLLAGLGVDLSQISRASAESIAVREGRFPSGRPLYTRVIAISYSAFDRFRRPAQERSASYVYCGIRNDRGALSRASLTEAYKSNQARIRDLGRQSEWVSHMETILGDMSGALLGQLNEEIDGHDTELKSLSLLSSGQAILSHFVTALLAWIEPKSIVLFDEPETHLHPNAVASLFSVLTNILSRHDSYALLATHSPVVIQEIPGKRVIVLRREENVTTAEPLGLESFGESVTDLTRHVFETIEVQSLYRKTLAELAGYETFDEVMSRFDSGLGLNARAYLLAQYAKKGER